MLALLPRSDATTFFVDVSALRKAGVLNVFSASKSAEEPEYQDFVRQTHFDYTHDIRAIAGAIDDQRILLIIRGRFDWTRLSQYASAHRGVCKDALCNLHTSKPGRWLSFLSIQPDVMGVAIASDGAAALGLVPHTRAPGGQIPSHPVWVKVAKSVLQKPQGLPVAIRIFAISLQSADEVTLSLDNSPADASEFTLELNAECPSSATADTIKSQLELQTRIVQMEFTREHQHANSGDLTGLLVAGKFAVQGKQMMGTWPIRKELFSALE